MEPTPDSSWFRLADGILGGAMTLLTLLWKSQNERIKEVKRDHDAGLKELRDNQSAIIEKMDQHIRRSEDRHVELLTALHQGLSGKVDK